MVLSAAGGAIAQVGVEAVVGKLKEFTSGFDKMNNMVDGFAKKGGILARAFEPVNRVLGAFFESLRRIGEFVVAGIILRGLDAIAGALRDIATEAINAAAEFQGLVIRLENFLAADIMKAGGADNMIDALAQAAPLAEELFKWIQQIAVTTPFDSQEIADAFTMAKAWGFATEEAKALTQQVIDFTAGMGFSGQEMDRVIKALGQMKSLGRVAGQELLQLANAGVPVAEIMNAIREELGLTTDEFEKLRMQGGVSAEMFFEQWDKLVSERFEGSAARMSRTIKGVLGNIKDLINGVLGFNVIRPVLDVLGEKLAGFFDALSTGENLERLLSISEGLGDALAGIAELFLGELPDPDVFAGKILNFLENFKNAMIGIQPIIDAMLQGNVSAGQGIGAILQVLGMDEETAGKIGTFADNLARLWGKIQEIYAAFRDEGFMAGLESIGLPEPIMNFFESLNTAWGNLVKFWEENGETIKQIISEVIGEIGKALGFQVDPQNASLIETLGELLVEISKWVVEASPQIIGFITTVGAYITGVLIPTLASVAKWIKDNWPVIAAFLDNFGKGLLVLWTISKTFAGIAFIISAGLIAGIGALYDIFSPLDNFRWNLQKWLKSLDTWLSNMAPALWAGFKAGFINGILSTWSSVSPYLSWFIAMVKWIFGISSPSKVFAEVGENLMEGMAMGIEQMRQLPELAMKTAVTHIIQPAISPLQSGVTTNNQTIQNFNMNINTQAKAEPIVADFRMMQSLASGGF